MIPLLGPTVAMALAAAVWARDLAWVEKATETSEKDVRQRRIRAAFWWIRIFVGKRHTESFPLPSLSCEQGNQNECKIDLVANLLLRREPL